MPKVGEVDPLIFKDIILKRHDEGIPWNRMAKDMGWERNKKEGDLWYRHGDGTKFLRAVGLAPQIIAKSKMGGKSKIRYTKSISYDKAVKLCKMLDIDPVELNL